MPRLQGAHTRKAQRRRQQRRVRALAHRRRDDMHRAVLRVWRCGGVKRGGVALSICRKTQAWDVAGYGACVEGCGVCGKAWGTTRVAVCAYAWQGAARGPKKCRAGERSISSIGDTSQEDLRGHQANKPNARQANSGGGEKEGGGNQANEPGTSHANSQGHQANAPDTDTDQEHP
eukprot:362046-Chlamydomonas_euryale.AAC.1